MKLSLNKNKIRYYLNQICLFIILFFNTLQYITIHYKFKHVLHPYSGNCQDVVCERTMRCV